MFSKFYGKGAFYSLSLFLLCFFFMPLSTCAQEANGGIDLEETPYPFYGLVTTYALQGYQRLIGPSREGMICPMHPSCSNYAIQAFDEYYPLQAFTMTADRLNRCGHDLNNYESIEVPQGVRFYDPAKKDAPLDFTDTTLNTTQAYLKVTGIKSIDPSNGNSGDPQNDVKLLYDFAANLEATGDYERAITEYQRLIFYYPGSELNSQAQVAVARCYYKAGHYLSTVNWGEDYLEKGLETNLEYELDYYVGAAYFKLGNYPQALKYYQYASETTDEDLRERSLILQGLTLAHQDKWNDAGAVLSVIPSSSKYILYINKCIQLSREGNLLKPKNPATASLLAIIPGLGYLYDGYNQSALSAFIVNVLFMSCTYNAFRQKNTALGVTSGILSFGWYAGNIYGSGISAGRKNLRMKQEILNQFDLGFSL